MTQHGPGPRDRRPSQDRLVLGGTGVLSAWLSDLVAAACARSEPPIKVRAAGFGEDSVQKVGRREGLRRALIVRQPNRLVLDALASRAVPTVAVLDDPVDMVRMSKARFDGDLRVALRDQTGSATAYHLLRDNEAVLVIRRGQEGLARDLVGRVLHHLDIGLEETARESVLALFAGTASQDLSLEAALARCVEGYLPLNTLAGHMTAGEVSIVRQVLSPMLLGALRQESGRIIWPQQVFWSQEGSDFAAPPVVDLTGGARTLFYGPYLHLPPGQWQATLVLAFSVEARRLPFRLVVQCNLRPIAEVTFRSTGHGAFEGAFSFRHDNPEHAVEINLMTQEGSIEGHVALGQLNFERLDW